MSDILNYILNGASNLIVSTIEQAARDAQPDDVTGALTKIKEDRMAKCDHGVTFDEVEAQKLLKSTPTDPNLDPALSFVLGSPATSQIRKRWPRLDGTCPKGCGYVGIAYASKAHYVYGDW